MKNKGNQSAQPSEWFYMNKQQVGVRDIRDVFEKRQDLDIELWEEAGVLELSLRETEDSMLEFERTKPDLGDAYSNDFLRKNHVQSLFFVTMDGNPVLHDMMEQITEALGGFFCKDTEDFTPVIGRKVSI